MASVVMEMSHEGFGRVVVFTGKIVLCEKFFKDAHRYSFRTYDKLEEEGEKFLLNAQETYNKYKNV
jgi:probable nitrogen fixation protein